MVLDLVRHAGAAIEWDRMLEPEEEAALRAVKGREAGPEERALYLRTVGAARARDLWFLCDCRHEEGGRRPVIVPRKDGPQRYSLVNLPKSRLPHAEGCVFGLVGKEGEGRTRRHAPAPLHDDRFDPFPPADSATGDDDGEDDDDGPMRPVMTAMRGGVAAPPRHRRVPAMLRLLMQTARLNRLGAVEGFSSPQDWLPEIRHAAERFFTPDGRPASGLVFAGPESWRGGAVARRLEEREPGWPEGRHPFAMLCGAALSLSDTVINPDHPREGRLSVPSGVASLRIGETRIAGPWVFLAIVMRTGKGGPLACVTACARPVFSSARPVPVDSGAERRAFDTLARLLRDMESDPALRQALGGPVRMELEKPLTDFRTAPKPCRPDFIVTVAPPETPRRDASDRDLARYVIEVMGSDDEEYRKGKAATHAPMRRIGRLFRMEAPEFDDRRNGIERQAARIMRDIAGDLRRRWGTAVRA